MPPTRQIGADGRPTVTELAEAIEGDIAGIYSGLLVLERRSDGDTIGYCGLIEGRVEGKNRPEIAFELVSEAQGQGYASEAAEQVIEWARTQGMPQLWADVWHWNIPSRKLLARLGFVELETTASTLEHASWKSMADVQGCNAVTPRTITTTLVL